MNTVGFLSAIGRVLLAGFIVRLSGCVAVSPQSVPSVFFEFFKGVEQKARRGNNLACFVAAQPVYLRVWPPRDFYWGTRVLWWLDGRLKDLVFVVVQTDVQAAVGKVVGFDHWVAPSRADATHRLFSHPV